MAYGRRHFEARQRPEAPASSSAVIFTAFSGWEYFVDFIKLKNYDILIWINKTDTAKNAMVSER